MPADSTHHAALLVADIDRAARFYIDAFDGRWLLKPVLLDGEAAEAVMLGPAGTAFRVGLVGLPSGVVELFELRGDARPDWVRAPVAAPVPHLGIQVDDTDAALARVEELGGRRIWPEVQAWGEGRVVYVEDLDGNVVELIDVPIATVVQGMLELFPDAAP